jgi:hypothetical protein
MKKVIVALCMMMAASGAFAQTGKVADNCGCGLGRMALGDEDATILSQLAATFLNAISGNQTFGMTSGTLDCAPATGVVKSDRVKEFIDGNMDQLAMDIAVGQGETLNALADLMVVPTDERADLFAKLQREFDALFTSHLITSDELVANLDRVVNG